MKDCGKGTSDVGGRNFECRIANVGKEMSDVELRLPAAGRDFGFECVTLNPVSLSPEEQVFLNTIRKVGIA